ncbi:MAG TPA: carboxypeptidase-like regulatory domain-containing protein [Candidatus Limnocylindria bacterium]|nr:carboxypeptidase-like regulatory domain-containing protein [Candidatus Limnocylindria bacterium]
MRHRNYVYVLVLLVAVVTLIGGAFNDVSARGRALDESTGDPVVGAQVIYGIRVALTGADGTFVLDHLPRGAKFSIQSRGYDPATGDTSTTEVTLHPFALSLQVNEQGSGDPPKPVAKPEIRQGDTRVGGPGTDTGSVVAAPYPQIGSQLLVCAADHDTATIEARGGAATPRVVVLAKGTQGCPPLPTPSPTPAPSPSPSGSPAPSASPTPTPSPSPSKTP